MSLVRRFLSFQNVFGVVLETGFFQGNTVQVHLIIPGTVTLYLLILADFVINCYCCDLK